MNAMTLYNLSAEMAAIEEALIDNGGELTPELETALACTSEALARKADDYGAVIQHLIALSDNAKAEIARVQAIKQSADKALANVKRHLTSTMAAFGIKRLEGDLHKFTLVETTGTVTDEEVLLKPYAERLAKFQEALPAWMTVKVSVSKSALKDAFEGADVMPEGVYFVKNNNLRIR